MSSDEDRDPLARIVAVAIVLATLLTAFVGYRAAVASRSDDRAAVDAQKLSVAAMEQTIRGQQKAQLAYETFTLAERQRRRAANATREALFRPAGERRSAVLERARWEQAAARTEDLTPIKVDGRDGPRADPSFPNRLLLRHDRPAKLATALQDARDEESVAWDSRGTRYASILTTLALALFLLGFTLSVPGGARLAFAGTGIVLALVGSFRTVKLESSRPELAPYRAAVAFADAEVAFAEGEKPADARKAVQKYTEAIRLRPSFARAYHRRSNAEFVAGSPELGGSFVSQTSDKSLKRSVADLLKARELGLESYTVLASLGANELLLGLREDDDALLEDAADHSRDALALQPNEDYIHSNLAVSLLALGKVEEARRALGTYLRYALFRNGDERTRRNVGLVEDIVAGTLSDLEIILLERPEHTGEARRAKQLIRGSASLGRVEAGSWSGSVGTPQAEALSNLLQVRNIRLDGFDFENDVLSIQWYGRVRRDDPWIAIPAVSGPVLAALGGSGEGELETEGGEVYFIRKNYRVLVDSCPPPGEYRVELFVNGRLVRDSRVTADFEDFDELALRSVDVKVCVPAEWQEDLRHRVPGVLEGVVSPDRLQGLYAIRIADANRLFGVDPRSQVAGLLERILERFPRVTPRRLRFDEAGGEYFAGLNSQLTRWYDYPGGRAIAGAGFDADGDFIVGLAYGPTASWTGEPESIFDSITVD